jgi:hypothetical protein
VFASADEPTLRGSDWIDAQWEAARLLLRDSGQGGALLVLDEVQKVPHWSEAVKRLWDADTRARRPLKVVLLGSAPLLVQRGLTESLAGRFEIVHLPHWTWAEMHEAFDWNLEQYLFYGGYPGAAPLIGEPDRWARYIRDSLIETTIARDVLLLSRVDKPAVLRRLFELGCAYSGQILSYTKMLGQLQDAGNTTTCHDGPHAACTDRSAAGASDPPGSGGRVPSAYKRGVALPPLRCGACRRRWPRTRAAESAARRRLLQVPQR